MLIKISFKYSFFIKVAFRLNKFNCLVININGEKNFGVGGGCCKCYIILGGGF